MGAQPQQVPQQVPQQAPQQEVPPQQQPHDWGYAPRTETYAMTNTEPQKYDLATTSGFFDEVRFTF